MKRAFIFGGGVYGDEFPDINENDFVIAADRGLEELEKHGIVPDLTVGDFDSSKKIPDKNAVVLPIEKDVTDSHAAVDIAVKNGCDEIHIYGGMGGRPDHTMANYSLVASLAKKGIKAFLTGEGYTVCAVQNSSLTLSGQKGKTVSVFSWTDKSEGVTLRGLKYPLNGATLTSDFALGVSNSFVDENAQVSVEKGILLVMLEA